jgi:hypothetical protein
MTISNSDNIIDSRDVIERIEELQAEREGLQEDVEEARQCIIYHHGEIDPNGNYTEHKELRRCTDELEHWEIEEGQELAALESLQEEAEGYATDWRYGATLIREDYFTEYAMELLADIGDLPRDIPHYIVIDEEATADNLKVDYNTVDFDGETYYIR